MKKHVVSIPTGQVGSKWYNPILDRMTEEGFPLIYVHESDEYAESDFGKPIMEFRLIYQGPLLAAKVDDVNDASQHRLKHKQEIRRKFHEQLEQLWKTDSRMKQFWQKWEGIDPATGTTGLMSGIERMSKSYQTGGVGWVPLVTERIGAVCSLNILFLRHEPKGGIVQSGDLDNRIKTLFDALRIPKENEIPHDIKTNEEPNPFFCLLSDDKLITDFRVTSDRLLTPNTNKDSDVHLVIEVRTFIADHEKAQWYMSAEFHR